MRAPLLGLAKSIYYMLTLYDICFIVLILVSVMFLNIIFSIFLNQVSISSEERSTGSLPR